MYILMDHKWIDKLMDWNPSNAIKPKNKLLAEEVTKSKIAGS